MIAKIVEMNVFEETVKNSSIAYNKVDFIELNREKVNSVLYLLVYKEDSPRFGFACGVNGNNEGFCPFSAPFGYIEPVRKPQTVGNYYRALQAIEKTLKDAGIKKLKFVLPPAFYDVTVINTWYSVLINMGWIVEYCDLNFAINIPAKIDDYERKILYNARKNLRIALKSKLNIWECRDEAEQRHAYEIIRINRQAKGYPLRMSENQVIDTMKVVPSSMFVVSKEEVDLAAALIYEVSDSVAQVVYWGDIPGHSDYKVINYLAYKLIQLYSERGYKYLDIGPSTEFGEPNEGLCDFKDSIGCERSAKLTLYKQL